MPGRHASFARDHEYKRHGTLSLLAGIDLLTGKVHALVRERHRSREFIEFLKLLDAAYPASTAIKLILDNHSAHISRETRAWLDTRPPGRFDFTFTPKHGSWLNLMAPLASPAQPEGSHELGADHEAGTFSPGPNPPSLALGSLRRHAPEVGAECPNRARSDLCGERSK